MLLRQAYPSIIAGEPSKNINIVSTRSMCVRRESAKTTSAGERSMRQFIVSLLSALSPYLNSHFHSGSLGADFKASCASSQSIGTPLPVFSWQKYQHGLDQGAHKVMSSVFLSALPRRFTARQYTLVSQHKYMFMHGCPGRENI